MRAALAAIASFLILTSTPAEAGFQYTTFRSAISPQAAGAARSSPRLARHHRRVADQGDSSRASGTRALKARLANSTTDLAHHLSELHPGQHGRAPVVVLIRHPAIPVLQH